MENTEQKQQSQQPQQQPAPSQQKLVDIEITDEISALNVLVNFINLAQKRGAFAIDESAKIFECIKQFQK